MWKVASILITVVLVLLCLGIVMLASTSSVTGGEKYRDPHHFLKRQLVWLSIGLVLGSIAALLIDYHWWRRLAIPMYFGTLVLLALVFAPYVGVVANESHRWLRIGSLRIGQPSEFAKFATIVVIASWMTHVGRRASRLKEGLLIPLGMLCPILVLTILEPDFGTTFLLGIGGFIVMFAGGTRLAHLVVTGCLGFSGFILLIMRNPVRMARILAFVNPAGHPVVAYQLRQSLHAFILGGGTGVGLGRSLQKHYYLPEAHTDFILAIVGEELGVGATLAVVVLFAAVLICGIAISLKSLDLFGRLLGFGLTAILAVQAAINIGVVTGCLPTKGLPLPFISAEG